MIKVKIFQNKDDAQSIFEELKSSGLVGVNGGRLEVRDKLKEVQALIEKEGLKGYFAHSSINHQETELGYGYDESRCSMEDAQKYVTQRYSEQA
jgi:hypothetical protein